MNNPEPAKPTVVLVENEHGTRDALETLITAADYRCISFASGEAFLAEPLPPAPCCLLLDLQLDGQSGLEVQHELNARSANLPVLFVSGERNIARAVTAMKAGALDFLQKPIDPDLLLRRVDQALQASADGYRRRQSVDRDAALLGRLTEREQEVLLLLVEGHFNKDIARLLDISTRTVESHRMHIMEKLEAQTLADLVRVWLSGNGDDQTAQRPGRW